MFQSATFKLTMWYLAIVMVISVGFSAALYVVTINELNHGLHRESQRLIQQYPYFQNSEGFNPTGPPPELINGSHRILLRLVGFNMIVLGGAGIASYWLARRTLQPIEIAHEQQKRFTADVSHELRTPLTALRMESEVALLNSKASAKELRDTLGSNLEEVTKLETLINNLLRLSRLEADELQQAFQAVDIKDTITEARGQLQKIADAKDIKLVSSAKSGMINGDPESLTQLLTILIDNAIKYSPSKSTIRIASKQINKQIQVTITDQGRGIDKTSLEHIFDRFYRGDQSRTKQAENEGFGLGLSIAKQISDIHNATITLTSQPDKGTVATLLFPIGEVSASSNA